jgi:hypothetical protein
MGQTWDIIYVDEMPDDLKKGDLAKDWGMRIDTPFHVISNLPDGRYLSTQWGTNERNLIIKTRNGFPSQEFFFDWKSRTIKSMHHKGWSWDI